MGGPAPVQLSVLPAGPTSWPLPSGAQQGSKENWAGSPPPSKPPGLARCLWGLETRAGEWGSHKQRPGCGWL